MQAKIAVLPGDGIGPEVTVEAVSVLKQAAECFGHSFHFEEYPIGRAADKVHGTRQPESTLEACRKADSVLMGALDVGLSRDEAMFHAEAERGLLAVKRTLGMMVSLRPVKPHPALRGLSPLRDEILEGVDLLIVRCLCNNMPGGCDQDTVNIVADAACRLARTRRNHVTTVDRAMSDEAASLRKAALRSAVIYPDVQVDAMPVDVCMQQMIFDPRNLDVILADNVVGAALLKRWRWWALGASAGRRTRCGHRCTPACRPMFDQAGVDAANPSARFCRGDDAAPLVQPGARGRSD
jgi:3-isopropylmalate dehydrogenase